MKAETMIERYYFIPHSTDRLAEHKIEQYSKRVATDPGSTASVTRSGGISGKWDDMISTPTFSKVIKKAHEQVISLFVKFIGEYLNQIPQRIPMLEDDDPIKRLHERRGRDCLDGMSECLRKVYSLGPASDFSESGSDLLILRRKAVHIMDGYADAHQTKRAAPVPFAVEGNAPEGYPCIALSDQRTTAEAQPPGKVSTRIVRRMEKIRM